MDKEKIDAIVAEFVSLGGAFVEDDYTDDEVYNPFVDRVTAEQWLRERLTGTQ